MTRAEAWLQHVANVLVGGTGLVYGWMRYFAEPADEFSIVNHPWQPELHTLHVLTAPILVFASALIWRDHVWKRVSSGSRPRRKLGLALVCTLFPMIASGYLFQTASTEATQDLWMWTHGLSSVLWLAAYVAHQVAPRG